MDHTTARFIPRRPAPTVRDIRSNPPRCDTEENPALRVRALRANARPGMIQAMQIAPVVEGPGWCEPGLDLRGGRYPLAVENSVLAMVDKLVPGVSTLTRIARYYSLYWALADFAAEYDLDAPSCRVVLRRAEVALAWASLVAPTTESREAEGAMHGADRVRTLLKKGAVEHIADQGPQSYSPRASGFWSQYGGPSVTLGTVSTDGGRLRPGSRPCPQSVRGMFRPLLSLVHQRPVMADDLPGLMNLVDTAVHSVDYEPLCDLMTASNKERRLPAPWNGNDLTRRATFRILARAIQLNQYKMVGWTEAMSSALAYGNHIESDPVLSREDRAQAWRGVLLRHHSVGAWRRLWSALVEHVRASTDPVTKNDLHRWFRGQVRNSTVRDFFASCPDTVDAQGDPLRAEQAARDALEPVEAELAILLIGARRHEQLSGITLDAFRGGRSARKQFLDPSWVGYQHGEHRDRPLGDFACALVDDMLAQSRRVALRKMTVDAHGRMVLFTKLHEREGRYFATASEGAGNVGLRTEQLGTLAVQLGMVEESATGLAVTEFGLDRLGLPQ